ncbi:UMP kinase [Thiomicrospira sp. R3]|uniref:UMP kinase n=1 Tax=Thiomicrospira sp. R3 TaxID=3035472 RepID=UPI00259B34B6|nr:UMP kinase [Thiomicrospira sp. R3]WFE68342.1 UMP kinase [Thiomicrospira sp. R3]
MDLKYKRILLKFSGEVLMGRADFGWDINVLTQVAEQVKSIRALGVEVAIVVGGGNVFRGAQVQSDKIQRSTADQMGMMATVMNAIALRDVFESMSLTTRVMSAQAMASVTEGFSANAAQKALSAGDVVVFAGGTGNPFFTTDTAAALRGIEVNADVVLKATKVDGIYEADPFKNPDAKRYSKLSYTQVIQKNLQVMDLAAFALCRDHAMPIRVFDMLKTGAIERILQGEDEGTLVTIGDE